MNVLAVIVTQNGVHILL